MPTRTTKGRGFLSGVCSMPTTYFKLIPNGMEADKVLMESTAQSLRRGAAIGLIALSCLSYVVAAALPFTSLSLGQKAIAGSALIVVGEATFLLAVYLGRSLVREHMQRVKAGIRELKARLLG
jgi:hypothetical protein